MKISAATTDRGNLICDRAAVDRAKAVVILIPGAFCRLSIFDAVQGWERKGYALVQYRFPGLDGRPLDPPLTIAGAAMDIAGFARAFGDRPVRLMGFSTGAAIAVTAAAQLSGDVRVAGLSPAVERAGGAETALRCARMLAAAALRVRSVRLEPVWLDYYRLLLFGERVLEDADLAAQAADIIAARRDRIVLPANGLPRAHTSDLRRWRADAGCRFAPGQVRLWRGGDDPVFSRAQVDGLARRIGAGPVVDCPGHGHLLFATLPSVFDDVLRFFEGGLHAP